VGVWEMGEREKERGNGIELQLSPDMNKDP
jgi:hypothetical protein